MSRWRPPSEKKAAYITPDGYAVLETELKELWGRRSGVTQALSEAAAEGDRSENAEYIYRKKELREIDRRIRYLQKRLPDLEIVRSNPNSKLVFFGAWVTLEDDDGKEYRYRIVGPDEIEPSKGWISVDSPVARALLKKQVDDEVTVDTPSGPTSYFVISVQY